MSETQETKMDKDALVIVLGTLYIYLGYVHESVWLTIVGVALCMAGL